MSERENERTFNAVEKVLGKKRVSDMTGTEYTKAVAQVTAELKESKPAKSNRK